MNRATLRKKLKAEGVRDDAYSVHDDIADESYVLEKGTGYWSVYYCERGVRTGERIFQSEEDACAHMYELLRADPTTKA